MRRSTSSVGAVVVALALFAGACGGGDGTDQDDVAATADADATDAAATDAASPTGATGGTTASPAAAGEKTACGLATTDEVTAETGRTVTVAEGSGREESKTAGGFPVGTTCAYNDSQGITQARISIRKKTPHYTSQKAGFGADAKPVTGVGDEAFCYVAGSEQAPEATLYVAKGAESLQIFVFGAGHCDGSVRQLADLILPKFS